MDAIGGTDAAATGVLIVADRALSFSMRHTFLCNSAASLLFLEAAFQGRYLSINALPAVVLEVHLNRKSRSCLGWCLDCGSCRTTNWGGGGGGGGNGGGGDHSN